ncbi:MAG: DUF2723 domain-containing protein [Chitinophagaceae bacterium]|nr:DUF2723 domain-containing protein [Chitinophagaceae bacterium]
MKSFLLKVPDTVYVFLFFFIFFAFNLTSNFSGPHDSMSYLLGFIKGGDLFPPHHLLYHITTYGVFRFLSFIFPHIPDYHLVEISDAIWGCLALTVVYRIFLHRIQMEKKEAFFSTCVVAFSFGIWFYCSNIEVYMPPLFFLISILYICMKPALQRKDILPLALLYSLSILFHQANVLITPVIAWKLWASRKQTPFLPSAIRIALISALLVGGLYVIIGWGVEGQSNFKDFYAWLRGYTLQSNYWFPLAFGTLIRALIGWGHAIVGGHFAFRVAPLQAMINKLFFYHNLDDEVYLVRNLPQGVALLLLLLTAALLATLLFLLIRVLLNARTIFGKYGYLFIPLGMFLIIYTAFFFFWMPENLEFWIPQTAVLWALLLGANRLLPPLRIVKKYYLVPAGLTLLLLIVNYVGSIHWMKDIENDSVYIKIKQVKQTASPGDIIILHDPWLLDDFLSYYTPSYITPVPGEPQKITALNARIHTCLDKGDKIYLFTEGSMMHSSGNLGYMDSLMHSPGVQVTDLHNPLTPVMIMTRAGSR